MSTYIVWFQFGSTLEIVSLEYSLLQESAVCFRIRFLMLLHFICWHANKESTKFIKDINKDGCSGIFNRGSQDISPSRLWIELVALFTSPAIITFLRKLLFTVGAAWIGCILLSDECKGCTYAKIFNLNISMVNHSTNACFLLYLLLHLGPIYPWHQPQSYVEMVLQHQLHRVGKSQMKLLILESRT